MSWENETYFIDENMKISNRDIEKINCDVINCTDIFQEGTPDEELIKKCKKNNWIMVSRDIRMALKSLQEGIPVIFISDDLKNISYLTANSDVKKHGKIHRYLSKRFGIKNH